MKDIRKFAKWSIFACVCSLGLLFACTDHLQQGDGSPASRQRKSKNEELTISVARQWYENHYAPVVTTRSSYLDYTERLMRPIWEKARERNRRRYEVVEIPMQAKGQHVVLDAETASKWKPGDKSDFIRNAAKIVILYDKKTKKTSSFVMLFVGSYKYLQKVGAMGRNSYLYREPDYDGSVLFYDLNGTFCNGWKYVDGKIVATISPRIPIENDGEQPSSAATRAMVLDCHPVCYTYYDEECYEEGFVDEDPEYGWGFGVQVECYPVSYEECYEECSYIDDGTDKKTDDEWDDDNPSGGKIDNPKPEKTEKQDPCNTSQSLSLDTNFRNKVDNYFDKNLTSKLEDGWMKTKNGEYIYPDIQKENSMNYSPSLTAGKVFVEQYHCHPSGQSCIPSVPDLQKMAFYYQKGRIDVANYSYGVISDVGCISIIITSEEEYAMFASAIYNTDVEKNIEGWLDDIWKECITNKTVGTPEESVGKLINFFNKSDAGLSVIFRTMSPENKGKHQNENWTPKNIDIFGNYINEDCN